MTGRRTERILRALRFRVGAAVLMAAVVLAPLVASGCGRGSEIGGSDVVARVGTDVITAEEFRQSYAFGFPHLTGGPGTPRENYLDRMIDERLLALDGYRLGLDTTAFVKQQIASMRAELLVEQIFDREVNDKVVVSDAQVRQAMSRDAVRFKLRYLPAPTRLVATELRSLAATDGFESAASRVAAQYSETPGRAPVLESGYLAPDEIDEALLEAVADLEPGELSAPIPFRGSFILVEVVDIRRDAVAGPVGTAEWSRMKHVQHQRHAQKLAREFVSSTMQPLDVTLKAGAYSRLRRHLWDWHRTAPPQGNLFAALQTVEGGFADSLRAMFALPIMTTRSDAWSVEKFLREFPADRYPLSTSDAQAFETDLYDAFGLTLRDRTFVAMAERQKLDSDPRYSEEMKRWTDKYVYRAMLASLRDDIDVTAPELLAYFDQHRDHYGADATVEAVEESIASDVRRAKLRSSILPTHLTRLRNQFSVSVDTGVLNHIIVEDPKSTTDPVITITKGHSGRPALPVVDPDW